MHRKTGSTIMSTEKTIRKPTTVAELKDMIVATGLSLPEQQERVARTTLAYPEIVAFGTAQSLADRFSVSTSGRLRNEPRPPYADREAAIIATNEMR
jgi:hypothetical protein